MNVGKKLMSGLKAQSAIEYLMTYGWMLLVVAVAGSAIFSVASDQQVQSISGFEGEDVRVSDASHTSDGSFQLQLEDMAIDNEVVKVILYDESTDNRLSIPVDNWDGGSIVETDGVTEASGTNTIQVSLIYNSGGLENIEASGTIVGSYEISETMEGSNELEADFTASDTTPLTDQTVYFDDNSTAEDSTIESYTWSVDGAVEGSGEEFEYEFPNEQQYTVKLEIDDGSTISTESKEIDAQGYDIAVDGEGTEENHYETIQEGVDAAADGDAVLIKDNTYDAGANINNNDLHIVGQSIENAVIQESLSIASDGVLLDSLSFRDGGDPYTDVTVSGDGVELRNLDIDGTGYFESEVINGILVDGGSVNITDSNIISASHNGAGISVENSGDVEIENSRLNNNYNNNGISVSSGTTHVTNSELLDGVKDWSESDSIEAEDNYWGGTEPVYSGGDYRYFFIDRYCEDVDCHTFSSVENNVVRNTDAEEFVNFQQAVDFSSSGDTFDVQDGVFEVGATIDINGLEFVGQGLDTELRGGLDIQADNVFLDSLSFRDESGVGFQALNVAGNDAELVNMDVQDTDDDNIPGDIYDGLRVRGSNIEVNDSSFRDIRMSGIGAGVSVEEGGDAKLNNIEISGTGEGLIVEEGSVTAIDSELLNGAEDLSRSDSIEADGNYWGGAEPAYGDFEDYRYFFINDYCEDAECDTISSVTTNIVSDDDGTEYDGFQQSIDFASVGETFTVQQDIIENGATIDVDGLEFVGQGRDTELQTGLTIASDGVLLDSLSFRDGGSPYTDVTVSGDGVELRNLDIDGTGYFEIGEGWDGVLVDGGSVNITDSDIIDASYNGAGISVEEQGEAEIQTTNLTKNEQSIRVIDGFAEANNSQLTSIAQADSGHSLNATENWWGSSDEPVEGEDYEGDVTYNPWCTNEECTELSN